MLSFLAARENGTHDPRKLERTEISRRVLSLELSKNRSVKRVHVKGVNTLDLDPVEERYLLSGGSDGVIGIYDVECKPSRIEKITCEPVCTIGRSSRHVHKNSVERVQWYPHDTGIFTSSSADKSVKIWDTNRLKPVETFWFKGNVYCHHMSPIALSHTLIAVGTIYSEVTLCDLKSGSNSHILKGHKGPVLSVKWSTRDDHSLATGSSDNRLKLWDIRMAKSCVFTLDQHNGEKGAASTASVNTAHGGHINSLCFTPDGHHLLSFGTDNRLMLWNMTTGKNTLVNYGKLENESRRGLSMDMSRGGSLDLAFVPLESSIAVMDVMGGACYSELVGHYDYVNCCLFHSTHQELYSGGNDRNILIWSPNMQSMEEEEKKIAENSQLRQGTMNYWSSDSSDEN